jgi:YHS domain-containing protein
MFRLIFYLIFTVVFISVLRAVMRIVFKGLQEVMNPNAGAQSRQPASPQIPLTGELKKDPSCGTYISAATSIKETVGGETFHFCSKQCRDKYVSSPAR